MVLNNRFGAVCAIFYAGLWYPRLRQKHYPHHLYAGTAKDPDYMTGNQNFFVW